MNTRTFASQEEADRRLLGKRVTVIGLRSGHGFPLERLFTVRQITNPHDVNMTIRMVETDRTFYLDDIKLFNSTIEDLQQEIQSQNDKIKEIKDTIADYINKIKFMKDHNLTEFDDLEFKVYRSLGFLDDPNLSKEEKAKYVSDIIKNG